MAEPRRTLAAALLLSLCACSGHGSASPPPPPPPPDAGGVWVGTWSGITPDMVVLSGPMVIEIHSAGATASGFATVPLVDGSVLGPAGVFGAYDQPVSGVVSVAGISLTGSDFHLAGWIDPPSAGNFPWEWPVWDLTRLWLPFDGEAAPSDLAGTWAVIPGSTMGNAPANETLTVRAVQDHVFAGSVERAGGSLVDLLIGRSSGSTVWFAVHDDVWSDWGIPAFRVWAGTLGDSSGQGVYAEYLGQYYELFDQGIWTATKR